MNAKRVVWHFCIAVLILMISLLCAVTAVAAEEDEAPRTVNVRDYGAVGDGVTNDTPAINLASATLRDGDTLYFPAGTYLVREHGEFSVILVENVKNVQIILDKDAIIQMDTVPDDTLPQQNRHFVLHLRNCENVTVTGGIIYGDRLRYTGTAHVEQGCGIRVSDGRNITIRDVEVAYFRGDGIRVFSDIYVDREKGVQGQSYDVTIDNCHVHDCFRNGITLTSVVGCVISNTVVHDIQGTAPQAAVDIEAEYPGSFNRDVTIENCHFYDNGKLSVAISQDSNNISILSSNLEQQFVYDENGKGLLLSDCTMGLVCISGKNAVIENCDVYQLRLYGSDVTCTDTVFDGRGDWIPFRVLVTKSDGTTVGRFENCTFRGRGLCALGGCIVFCHTPPESMEFIDCTFKSCGLIPFLGELGNVERSGCFFDLGWALWLCILAFLSLIGLIVCRARKKKKGKHKKVWICK